MTCRSLQRLVLPIVLCAVLAPSASASTAFVTDTGALAVVANPGEKNYVTVNDPGVTIEVGDTAGIMAGAGCEPMSATRVRCPGFQPAGVGSTLIDLGDGDDFYHEQSELFKDDVNAGSGNDEIYTDRETDVVRGQEGDDKIFGGGASDQLDGGPGNDTVTGGDGDDTIIGGTGEDILTGDGDGLYENGSDTIAAEDNGGFDRVTCAGGADYVTADANDSVNATCDDVKIVSSSGGGGGGGGEGMPQVSVKPARTSLAAFLKNGLAFTATTNEAVSFAAVVYVKAATARKLGLGTKDTRIAQGGGTLAAGTKNGRLTKRFKTTRLRALLEQGGSAIPVVFQVIAQDADGNPVEVVRALRLKR